MNLKNTHYCDILLKMKKNSILLGVLVIALVFTITIVGCDDDNSKSQTVIYESFDYESIDTAGNTYILVITGKTSRATYTSVKGDSYELTIKKVGYPNKESKGNVSTIGTDGILGLKPKKADSEPFNVNVSSGKMTAITGKITLEDGEAVPAPGVVTPVETFTSVASMATWLKAQSDNTVDTPYGVKLNVNKLGGPSSKSGSTGAALIANNTKYVNLDLSGSTFTTFDDFQDFLNCTSLTSVTMPPMIIVKGNIVFPL